MVKKLINGMVFGSGICIVIGVFMMGIYFVKGTDPLTATDGETLTAAKWNALVSEVQGRKYVSDWKNVSVSSTAPGDGVHNSGRNTYTFIHNLNSNNVSTEVMVKCSDGKIYQGHTIEFYHDGARLAAGYNGPEIKSSNEIIIRTPANGVRGNRKIFRYCASGTAGQYKVIVTAHD